MKKHDVLTSVSTFIKTHIIFFSHLLAIKSVIRQLLQLFNRIDKSLCLQQLCIFSHTPFHFNLPKERLLLLSKWKSWVICKGRETGLFLIRDLGTQTCAPWLLPLWRQSHGSNFSIAGETPWFFHVTLQLLENVLEVRCWTKLSISISNAFHTD